MDEAYESPNGVRSNIGKTIPKIKVCHKSNEFAVLSAMMNKLNSQNIKEIVSCEQSLTSDQQHQYFNDDFDEPFLKSSIDDSICSPLTDSISLAMHSQQQ